MRVVILHSDVRACASADERDVLTQVEAVEGALKALGHEVLPMPFCLDLEAAAQRLRETACDLVFNLVETVGGQGRLIHLAPVLLDFLRIPYTGAGTEATFLSSNKLAAKKLLHAHRLRTPPWCTLRESSATGPCPSGSLFIVKSVWEHASVGLEEDSVVCPRDARELREEIRKRLGQLGEEAFAERYIDGRELVCRFLPEARVPKSSRLRKSSSSDTKKTGFASSATGPSGTKRPMNIITRPGASNSSEQDRSLLRSLKRLALRCWRLFELTGYARVDYRVDRDGIPWILEINSNPCLSPDSGFTAATRQGGLRYEEVIGRIVEDAFRTD